MHFLLLFIIYWLLQPTIVVASPWLPKKGEFKSTSSIYITDKPTLKAFAKESQVISVKINREIALLEQEKYIFSKDPRLTPEAKANRITMNNQKIHNLKMYQSYMRKYYPKRQYSQSLEYGVSDKYSLGFKIISTDERDFNNEHRSYDWFQLSQKIKIYQNAKYMISVQPSMMIYKSLDSMDDFAAEMRFLMGRVTKHKLGKVFNNVEIAHGVASGSQTIDLNYTIALETKRGNIIMLQSFNHFQPKADKFYQNTTLDQISIAKPVIMDNYGASKKFTLQVGYFNECSISARKIINRGLLVSIWAEM